MRLLFVSWAWPSHLFALVPLARACAEAGHDVCLLTQPALVGAGVRAGLPTLAAGQDVETLPAFRELVLSPRRNGPRAAGRPPRVLQIVTAVAEAMAPDTIALTRSWRPDLVIYEPTALAGPLAAAAARAPAIRHLYGVDLLYRAREPLSDALGRLGAPFGLHAVDPIGARTLDPCPAALQVPVGYRPIRVRYQPCTDMAGRPRLPVQLRPRVCVTWGTTMARLDHGLFLAGQAAAAAAAAGLEVVAAVTTAQRPLLGELPAGVTVLESAALTEVVESCSAVIAHGGASTVLTSLLHGVPSLLVPQLPDHAAHAGQVAAAGAGLVLPRDRFGAPALRALLGDLLGSARYRASAAAIQAEMRSQPTCAEVVPVLERTAELSA